MDCVRVCGRISKVDAVVCVLADCVVVDVVVVIVDKDSVVAVVVYQVKGDIVVGGAACKEDAVVHAVFYCIVVYPGIVRINVYAIEVV